MHNRRLNTLTLRRIGFGTCSQVPARRVARRDKKIFSDVHTDAEPFAMQGAVASRTRWGLGNQGVSLARPFDLALEQQDNYYLRDP